MSEDLPAKKSPPPRAPWALPIAGGAPGSTPGHDHDHDHGHDHDEGDCMADALRAEIARQVAGEVAAEPVEACPMPSEATDFLHWPWVWRFGQFFFVLALAWSFWPAAANFARLFLYAATAATMVGSWIQMARGTGGAPVKGGWLTRWRLAVLSWPEMFSGPLWLATAAAIGGGFYLAAHGADQADRGRSLNAFVEKSDALLIGLVGFVQFRFTASRKQPFWLMGLICESWLIGLSAVCAVFVSVYAWRTGWPVAAHGAELSRAAAGPLSGWGTGYGTAFAHLAAIGGLLAVARAVGDPLWWTSRADAVTAARIKAMRVILLVGNFCFAALAVAKWQDAAVHRATIGWPDVDQLKQWTTTVYAESFGGLPAGAVVGWLAGGLVLCAVVVWRGLGQRVAQMPAEGPGRPQAGPEAGTATAHADPASTLGNPVHGISAEALAWRQAQASAGSAAREHAPGWAAWGWLAAPLLATFAAVAASEKKLAVAVVVAGGVTLVWLASRARDAYQATLRPAPGESGEAGAAGAPVIPVIPVIPGAPVAARRGLAPMAAMGGLLLLAGVGLFAKQDASLLRSLDYRRVWWTLAERLIAQAPGGTGFGTHIYRDAFTHAYVDSPAGAAELQALIPDRLRPKLEPGWGSRDLAFHEKWLTWELSQGFDTHDGVLQALFEGGFGWLTILALALATGVFLRGGFGRGPSVVLDLLILALVVLLLFDVPAGNLEKMAACIMAAWVAWEPLAPAVKDHVTNPE